MSDTISIIPQKPPELERRLRRQAQNLSTPDAPRAPTFALYTLGCKVNQSDSHQIARLLRQRGFRHVAFRECADLYVIDTCTVTAEADKKSRKIAARAHRNNPDALIAVTGCAVASDAAQFRRVVPDTLLLDNARKLELPDLAVEELQKRHAGQPEYSRLRDETASEPVPVATRERAVLKVQDGCNHRCAFCIIPSVRGASQTKSRAAALSEARDLAAEGAKEITITGVSLGDYRNAELRAGRNANLCSLLREVAEIEGVERVRVSSLDPADVDEEFLQTVAHHPKICPHIHLALQGGSAALLRRMRRRYTPELFLKWARRWREIRPDGALTTDIIVGFPGENEDDWQGALQIAREAKFSAIHVFPYSLRPGTVAADFETELFIAPAVQKRRVAGLLALAEELSAEYSRQFLGQVVPVLIERVSQGGGDGMIPHYVKTRVEELPPHVQTGAIVPVRIVDWKDETLIGRVEAVET
jgi:threonylcarbamoyladenosine tRNA methylthiotransferase MtaB